MDGGQLGDLFPVGRGRQFPRRVDRYLLCDVAAGAVACDHGAGTLQDNGRENGILAGANVCMPNLSPADVRKKYALYDNKRAFGSEAAEEIETLKKRMDAIGYQVVVDRGDRKEI